MFEINGVLVQFRMESRKAGAESRKKGRPVYVDLPVVDITNPNDQMSRVVRAATDQDKIKYRKAWTAFVNEQGADGVSGTPLREWRGVTRAQAHEAAYFKVLTVEQLADAGEDVIAELGPEWYALRKDAALYIQDSDAGASAKAAAEENADLRKQLEEMQRLLAEKSAPVVADEPAQERRKPGRPPKVAEDSENETKE